MAMSKREKAIKAAVVPGKAYAIDEAIKIIKTATKAKFVESVDVAVRLGVDAKKSDQQVRGSTVLPAGTGKSVRVAVFAPSGAKADEALADLSAQVAAAPQPAEDDGATLAKRQKFQKRLVAGLALCVSLLVCVLMLVIPGESKPPPAPPAPEAIRGVLQGPDVPAGLIEFFRARGVEVGEDAAPELPGATGDAEQDAKIMSALPIMARIKFAMKGTREQRAQLIRDPNKMVSSAVLSSPKLSDQEVESIAKMPTISDEILRMIAHTRAWVKNYGVVLGLVKNPKTPLAISMNLLQRLNDRDMRLLSQDRNIPDTLRVTARKKVVVEK